MATIINKEVVFGENARHQMYLGATKLYTAVKATLGPKGRLAVIEKFDRTTPIVTKDGVTVAESIALGNRLEDIGLQLIKSVSSRAGTEVGDGTTTTTILAYNAITHALTAMEEGANPITIQQGIRWAAEQALVGLQQYITPVTTTDELRFIATISSNNDAELGANVSDAFEKAGEHGMIVVSDEPAIGKDEVNVPSGTYVKRGYESPYFVKPGESTVNMQEPLVVLIDNSVEEADVTQELLDNVVSSLGSLNRPVWIVAHEFDVEIVKWFVTVNRQYKPGFVLTRAPGFANRRRFYMEDLAILTSAKLLGGFDELTSKDVLGTLQTLRVTEDTSTFTYPKDNRVKTIEDRVTQLKAQLDELSSNDFARTVIEDRLAMLNGKIVEIKVGGYSDGAHRERKDRYDDAIRAVGAARQYGTVAGAGLPHLLASFAVNDAVAELDIADERRWGASCFAQALRAPLTVLLENAGYDKDKQQLVLDQISSSEDPHYGINLATNELGNLREAGVIDPAKVAIASISIASELAGLFISTETIIVEDKDDKSNW